MPLLKVFLLGPPRIEIDGHPVHVEVRKATALLAFLVMTGESYRRDSLVNLLWPEFDMARGRAVLRRTLSALRAAIGSQRLDADREQIGLRRGAEVWLDVNDFRARLEECRSHPHPESEVCPACQEPLTQAVQLYRDDFLSGFTLPDSINFDDWQFFQAENLRSDLGRALERLALCSEAQKRYESAIIYARRWLGLDPLNEKAHRLLMLLYAWSGQRSAALHQYQECTNILARQLNQPPEEETIRLCRAIQAGQAAQRAARGWEAAESGKAVSHFLGPAGRSPGAGLTGESHLVGPTTQPAAIQPVQEKRVVTVLASQQRGPLSAGPDPADVAAGARWSDPLPEYCRSILERYAGRLIHASGRDLIFAFGAPLIREGDAELAIRAALELLDEAKKRGLSTAVAAHTGEVYIRPSSGEKFAMLGEAIDRVDVLVNCANDGELLTSETTGCLVQHTFALTPVSRQGPAGSPAVPAFRVERLLFQPRKTRGIEGLQAELIGREEELGKLLRALRAAQAGSGQVALLVGEAGVGKTRLVEALRAEAVAAPPGAEPFEWLEGRCLEFGIEVSYWPFIDLLKTLLGWRPGDDDRRHRDQVRSLMSELVETGGLTLARGVEIEPLICRLLSITGEPQGQVPGSGLAPEQFRQKICAAIVEVLLAVSWRRPLVLVLEDLHWTDRMSLDLILSLFDVLDQAQILLLCVYRPGQAYITQHLPAAARQKCRGRLTEIHLPDLTRPESQRFLVSLLQNSDLGPAFVEAVWQRTNGNPFYMEEMVRSMIENGLISRQDGRWVVRPEFDQQAIPTRLQGVLLSSLGCLEPSLRGLLEAAAVIGRVFPTRLLARVASPEIDLGAALSILEDQGWIYQERVAPQEEYSFKHILIQEAIYQSQWPSQRRSHHLRVAEAIEHLFGDGLEERAGATSKALHYLYQSGQKAIQQYANEAAIHCFSKGIELLQTLPESPERDRQELEFQIALGVPLVHGRGHSAPEVATAYTRARVLCQKAGDFSRLFDVLSGQRRYQQWHGGIPAAYELSLRLVEIAQDKQDPIEQSRAHAQAAETCLWMGRFEQVVDHCCQGLTFYDPDQAGEHIRRYGTDTGLGFLVLQPLALWHLGHLDQARSSLHEALGKLPGLDHPFNRCLVLCFTGYLAMFLRDPVILQALSQELLEIAAQKGYAFYQAWGALQQGWALAAQGQPAAGLQWIRRGQDGIAGPGIATLLPESYAIEAEALGWAGRGEDALRAVELGLEAVAQTRAECWEAELCRLKGDLLAQPAGGHADSAAAVKCFREAIAIARRQKSLSWEARAAESLARLQQDGEEGKLVD